MELKKEDAAEPNDKKNWMTTCGQDNKCHLF